MACRAPRGLSPAHVTGAAVTHYAADDASLRLTSRADRGGYVIAALSGELGIASAPALREQLLSLAAVRDLRVARAPVTAEDLAPLQTDVLAGFVLARAAAGCRTGRSPLTSLCARRGFLVG
jgi:hypothetical protein